MSRRVASKIDVNLFPFLSVLCAMIGVLILFLLLTLSARVMETADVPASSLPAPARSESAVGDLDSEEFRRLQSRIDELTSSLVERRKQISELSQLQAELFERLAATQSARRQGESPTGGGVLEPREDVQLVPDPQYSVKKQPRFLEIRANEIVLLPQGRSFSVDELRQSDSALQRLLEDIDRNRDREYLLLLIRPDGTETFRGLRAYLYETFPANSPALPSRIDVGYEPFLAGWVLMSQDFQGSNQD